MLCSCAVSVYVTYWVSVLTICGAKVVSVFVTVTRAVVDSTGSVDCSDGVVVDSSGGVDDDCSVELGCTSVVVAVGTAMFTRTGKHPSKLSEQ